MSVKDQRIKRLLLAEQDNMCPWCGWPILHGLYRIAADHIIPKCRGGPDDYWNRQVLHEQCNKEKSRNLTDQAIALAADHGITLV